MMGVFFVPMILRPLDFVFNAQQYLLGLLSYIILLPVFTNVMMVYSMCNLHDISWGNRPSVSSGTDALSSNAKKQQELKANYQVFRVNFLACWILMNAVFALVLETTYTASVDDTKTYYINDGKMQFITVFALFMSGIVVYRVGFALIHLFKFKTISNISRKYKVTKFNLNEDVKKLR